MQDAWLSLLYSQACSVSAKRFLIEHLGTPEAVLQTSPRSLMRILESGFSGRVKRAPLDFSINSGLNAVVTRDTEILRQYEAIFLPFTDKRFPALLNTIDDPPLGLFCLGNTELLELPSIAIVGSRSATRAGRQTARSFARTICQNHYGIVSGLALGIDAEAHLGALDAGGHTIAVVATGIDRIYPQRNRKLHQMIAARGLIVSEYPPQTPPRRGQFPKRNRIISGLSQATLVVEAGMRSGSLVTARLASEQGREVYAVPGPIQGPASKGCHYLLKQGAGLAEEVSDVLAGLAPTEICLQQARLQQTLNTHCLDNEQKKLFELIEFVPCPVDQLILDSGLPADKVSSVLIQLELRGLVFESVGGYQRAPEN